MSIWVGENAKVLIQGITGNQGRFHGAKMVEYGTEIVGGVTPRKGGSTVTLHNLDLPVYDTMNEAIIATEAEVSVIYVPPPYAAAAIKEAAKSFHDVRGEGLIVCITEGIPILDMIDVVSDLEKYPNIRLIGPNCPGIITPGAEGGSKIGIMPGHIHQKLSLIHI